MVQIVIGANDEMPYGEAMRGLTVLPPLAGGPTRQHSVMHGLEALAHHKPDYVLIHDAARPLVSSQIIDGVIAALRNGADAAVPLLPVADTLRRRRQRQMGHRSARRPASRADAAGISLRQNSQGPSRARKAQDVTDDMALAELAGLDIVVVPGEESNIKITTPKDFAHGGTASGRAARRDANRLWL